MKFNYGKLTVERQLQMYERHPDKSERSATLLHAWHQNKSWLIRLLELTLASFPSYSRHDASHAEAVLHNIERILGKTGLQSSLQQIVLQSCIQFISMTLAWQSWR